MIVRYFILVLLGVFGVIVSGSTAALMGPVRMDIALLLVLAIALAEEPVVSVIFAAGTGFFMDVMYSINMGMHALSCTIVALCALAVVRQNKKTSMPMVFLAGVIGFILTDVITGIFAYVQGARFDFLDITVRSILPSAALNGILLIVTYYFINKLFCKGWMKKSSSML